MAAQDAPKPVVADRSGARALNEALDCGRETLSRLEQQGEQMHRAEVVARRPSGDTALKSTAAPERQL